MNDPQPEGHMASYIQRRKFLATLGGAAATWPLAARAQQPAMPVIGFLHTASPDAYALMLAAFHRGLHEAGYVEGRNVAIEYRWGAGQYDQLPALAADLVRRGVAVIAATGGESSVLAAKAATATIPIVFISTDPVKLGLVASLNRPGGKLTGVNTLNTELVAKRLELLHELVPTATIIGALINPESPTAEALTSDLHSAARILGLQLHVLHASTEREIDTAFRALAQLRAGGLVIGSDGFFNSRSERCLDGRPPDTCDLPVSRVRCCRRPDELRRQYCGLVPSRWRLYRTHPQRREAGRPPGAAVHKSRADHQSQDRPCARHHFSNLSARPRRRGDRVM